MKHIWNLLAIIVVIFIAVPMTTYAATSDFEYSVNGAEEAIIRVYNGSNTVVNVPETIAGYPVTGIGDKAFRGNKTIVEVNLPETITVIGKEAFADCHNLSNINLPNGLIEIGKNAFLNCGSLTEINVPCSLEIATDGPFMNCLNLQNVTFEDGITKIIPDLFCGCGLVGGLRSIDIPETITEIGDWAFASSGLDAISLPANLQTIGTGAFQLCDLQEIVIPNSVNRIGIAAFSTCTSLSEISIPSNCQLDENGYALFQGCYNLKTVELPKTITAVATSMFSNCDSLEKIVLPDNVQTIESNAFESCDKLIEIRIPEKTNSIDTYAFEGTDLTQVTVYGIENSYAQEWASTVGAKFIPLITTYINIMDLEGNHITGDAMLYDNSEYVIEGLEPGTYEIMINSDGNKYVWKSYKFVVGDGPVSLDLKLHKTGDITGDDTINARDKKMLFNHIAGSSKLEDYDFAVADVNGDGVINARDKKMVFSHIAGTSSLWE